MQGDKLVIQEHHIKAARYLLDLLSFQIIRKQDTLILSIAGESGSGKSEVAAVLSRLLAEEKNIKSIIIQQDDYFVYAPKTNDRKRRKDIGHVGLSEVHLDLLDQNLGDILKGKSAIKKPLVIFGEDRITEETINLAGIGVVIVEGTYTTLLGNVHQRIFIDRTYIETRQSREQRAREEQDEYLEKILEIEHRIIASHKTQSDIILTSNYEVKRNERKT
jgi:uridine kinase